MRRRALLWLAVISLAAPAGARSDTQISTERSELLTAHGDWTSWAHPASDEPGADYVRTLWHRGARSAFPYVTPVLLGSNRRGRPVGVHVGTRRVIERRLVGGRERTLARPRGRVAWADELRGVVALGYDDRGVYIRRARRGRLRRIAKADPIGLALAARHVVWMDFKHETPNAEDGLYVYAADWLGRRRRLLAVDSSFDDDCKCTQTGSRILSATADGGHAYWLRHDYDAGPGQIVGTGITSYANTWTIFRADLTSAAPRLEELRPRRPANAFAVGGGRVVYAGPGIVEIRDPVWVRSDESIPER